ncbi:hypothetical protein J6590_061272, partial [Homalodisca vitripennis]
MSPLGDSQSRVRISTNNYTAAICRFTLATPPGSRQPWVAGATALRSPAPPHLSNTGAQLI